MIEKGTYKYIGFSDKSRYDDGIGEGYRHRDFQIVKYADRFHPDHVKLLNNQFDTDVDSGVFLPDCMSFHYFILENLDYAFELFCAQTKDQDLKVGDRITVKKPLPIPILVDVWTLKK